MAGQINEEIITLCEVIAANGTASQDNTYTTTFGTMFGAYEQISENLVSHLRRAKKQGLVEFEGEMLFQGKDDGVVIKLLKSPEEIPGYQKGNRPAVAAPTPQEPPSGQDSSDGKPTEVSNSGPRSYNGVRINEEIVTLCEVTQANATPAPDNTWTITFGKMFEVYEQISENLVAHLRRAKKQRLVEFEGEMLFQGRDDNVVIKLLVSPDDLSAI